MKQAFVVFVLILLSCIRGTFANTLDPSDTLIACTLEYNPVCSTDGTTYPNSCVATQQYKATISHMGACNLGESKPSWRLRVNSYISKHIGFLELDPQTSSGNYRIDNIQWMQTPGANIVKTDYQLIGELGFPQKQMHLEVFASGSETYITPKVELDTTFTLKKNSVVRVGSDGLIMKLIDLQDSTCPANVQCIWAGEKTLQIGYKMNGIKYVGKDLLQAFGYRTEVITSDYATYATVKVTRM